MSLNLPILNIKRSQPTLNQKEKRNTKEKNNFNFDPLEIDIAKSKLSRRMKDLIIDGKNIDMDYAGDESSAFFAACIAMAGLNFNDNEIASVLTDRNFYISNVSYRHAGNTNSRWRAAKWAIEQNVLKARRELVKKNIFEQDELTKKTPKVEKFKAEEFKDISFDLNSSALVENLIAHESLVLIYGDTNTGKTFAALDLALHIAQGQAWQNKKVEQGAVLYVATEGGYGIKKRILALKKAFNLETEKVPMWLLSTAIDLSEPRKDAGELVDVLRKIEESKAVKIRFLIIDTLNRAYAGGDENSSSDMGNFLKCIDLIREKTTATIALVHHSGKEASKGARGHSSLKGAIDTEIRIEADKKNNTLTASTTKQREYEYGPSMKFKLEQVEVGKNMDGKSITSCVLRPLSLDASDLSSPKPLNRVAKNALNILNELKEAPVIKIPKSFNWPKDSKVKDLDLWKKRFKDSFYKDKHRSTFHSAFLNAQKELEDNLHVEVRQNFVRLIEEV